LKLDIRVFYLIISDNELNLDQIKKHYVHVQANLVFLEIFYIEAFEVGNKGFLSDNF
jgi:hypothetical protein